MSASTHWGIRYPALTDVPDVPLWMERMATDLDSVAMQTQGLFSARGSAATRKSGFRYYCTDTGVEYISDGTAWQHVIGRVPTGSITATELATDSVDTAEIKANAVGSSELADNAVDEAAIAAGAVAKSKLKTDALNAFLKLLVAGDKKVAWGTDLTPNYSGDARPTKAFAHGLGVVPALAFGVAGSVNTGSQQPVVVSLDGTDDTNLTFRFYAEGYTGPSYSAFTWMAIG